MTDEELATLRRDVQEGAEALLRTHRILSQKQARITELEREVEAWRELGRALVQTPAHTRQTVFYPPSAIESVTETIVQIDPDIQAQARALLGMADSEGETQS